MSQQLHESVCERQRCLKTVRSRLDKYSLINLRVVTGIQNAQSWSNDQLVIADSKPHMTLEGKQEQVSTAHFQEGMQWTAGRALRASKKSHKWFLLIFHFCCHFY